MAERMDRNERRRKRLLLLLEEIGSAIELAERADTDPSYISQIKTGARVSFGDDVATRFEQAAHKPDGWLDQWLPEEGGWNSDRSQNWVIANEVAALSDTGRRAIRDQIKVFRKIAKEAMTPAKKGKNQG